MITDTYELVDDDPPRRRLTAAQHLARAAICSLRGDVERYHLEAAAAESLTDIAALLAKVVDYWSHPAILISPPPDVRR